MPLGSLSDAPATMPGPMIRKKRRSCDCEPAVDFDLERERDCLRRPTLGGACCWAATAGYRASLMPATGLPLAHRAANAREDTHGEHKEEHQDENQQHQGQEYQPEQQQPLDGRNHVPKEGT